MFIVDGHIVKSVYLTDDFVIHRDNTGLQTATVLEVELTVLQKKNIGCIAANIHDEDTRRIHNQRTLRNYRSICLREDHNSFNYNTIRLFFVDKLDYAVSLEVLCELILQDTIVLRGKTDSKLNLLERICTSCSFHFLGDGNQTQNEVAFIRGLIASIIKTLSAESPVFATVLKNFIRQRWFHRMLGKAGDERMVFGFYCIVTMINCD